MNPSQPAASALTPVDERMREDTLPVEEEHADDLNDLPGSAADGQQLDG
jgi:hypothetical protein